MPLWEDVDIKYNQDKKSGFICPPSCFPGSVVTGPVWARSTGRGESAAAVITESKKNPS